MAKKQYSNPSKTEAAAVEKQARSANSVIVALNRATGIQFEMPGGRRVVINGNAVDLRGKEKGILPMGAYGLTQIAADDWEYIQKAYGCMEIFKHGLIFARERKADAMDEADEKKELRHGLEPINVDETATSPANEAA